MDNLYHFDTVRTIELLTAATLYILCALVTEYAPNFVAPFMGLASTAGTICFPKDDPTLLLLKESNFGTHVKMISGTIPYIFTRAR